MGSHSRIRTSPRKSPSQERSRATVDAIVAATARVLVKVGYEACSTNRVAREAGVSVGSLYQYFPSKESLVLAVMERHASQMRLSLEERLARLEDADVNVETLAHEIVGAMLALHRVQPRLYRVLVEQVPRIGELGRRNELYRRYEALIAAWMEAHREQLELEETSLAAYVLVTAVEGLTNRALVERPELMASGKLHEHIVRLALGYVAPSRVARARAEGRALGAASPPRAPSA